MPLTPEDIQAAAPAPAALPVAPEAPAAPPAPESQPLPEEVLRIPAMNALLKGTPPAVSAPLGSKSPEVQTLIQNAPALTKAGFGYYQSKDGKQGVMFNRAYIDPGTLQLADEKGQLDAVAPPITDLISHFNDALKAPGAAPAAPAPPPSIVPSGGTSAAEKKLQTARIKNSQPGSPTSGPAPGQGRLLNNILKQPV